MQKFPVPLHPCLERDSDTETEQMHAESEMFAELSILYIGKPSLDNVHDLFCFSTEGCLQLV